MNGLKHFAHVTLCLPLDFIQKRELSGGCIGYLDHPFEKEDSWAFTARIFLVVKWGLAIEIAGKSSHRPEKPRVFGQRTRRTGLQRWQEWPGTDLFSHELSAGLTLSI